MKQNRYNYSLITGLDTYSPKTSLWRLAVSQDDARQMERPAGSDGALERSILMKHKMRTKALS